ncbi:MAG: LolA family protein [bacterium]
MRVSGHEAGPRFLVALALALSLIALPTAQAWSHSRREEPSYGAREIIRRLLVEQDRRYWTRTEVIKVEQNLDRHGKPRGPRSTTRGLLTTSGDKARLQIRGPAKGLIVADGKYLWVELPQVAQVYRYDQASLAASGNFFLDLASSIRHYAQVGLPRRIPPGRGYNPERVEALELLPKPGAEAGFRRLRVWVNVRRWVVLRVLLDYGGLRDDIRFPGVQAMSYPGLRADPGQALPKSLFHYRRPRGYQVFKMDL